MNRKTWNFSIFCFFSPVRTSRAEIFLFQCVFAVQCLWFLVFPLDVAKEMIINQGRKCTRQIFFFLCFKWNLLNKNRKKSFIFIKDWSRPYDRFCLPTNVSMMFVVSKLPKINSFNRVRAFKSSTLYCLNVDVTFDAPAESPPQRLQVRLFSDNIHYAKGNRKRRHEEDIKCFFFGCLFIVELFEVM